MIGLTLVGLIDTRGRILLRVAAKVAHVAEHMALGILRARAAEVRADAKICGCRLADRPRSARKARGKGEAGPVDNPPAEAGHLGGTLCHGEVALPDAAYAGRRFA